MFDEQIFIPSESLNTFNSYDCHIIRNNKIISFNKDTCNTSTCHLSSFVIEQKHYLVQYEDIVLNQQNYLSYMTSCDYPTYTSFTSDPFYRFDIDSILCIFIILLIILFYFPYRIISRMFGRWFKW